jgi:hypothetical protein
VQEIASAENSSFLTVIGFAKKKKKTNSIFREK